jgi:SAM-dependent methyltransferase
MGFAPRKFLQFIKNLPGFYYDYRVFRKQLIYTNNKKIWPVIKMSPVLYDKNEQSGILNGAYFHQDLLVARKIYGNKPLRHIDIGSRTDGFVAHVAVFRPIEIIDIRPLQTKVQNISFLQADFMKPLPNELIDCCDSVSSLHAIEHFGLGRYGDPIDPDGHLKALNNIYQMLKKKGTFYFGVPFGPQRIEFNGQRVFSMNYLLSLLVSRYEVIEFSYVDDAGDLHENVTLDEGNISTNWNCNYGCALFELGKL